MEVRARIDELLKTSKELSLIRYVQNLILCIQSEPHSTCYYHYDFICPQLHMYIYIYILHSSIRQPASHHDERYKCGLDPLLVDWHIHIHPPTHSSQMVSSMRGHEKERKASLPPPPRPPQTPVLSTAAPTALLCPSKSRCRAD